MMRAPPPPCCRFPVNQPALPASGFGGWGMTQFTGRAAAVLAASLGFWVTAGSSSAHAASAGCTAANAGGFDQTVPANTTIAPTVNGALDRGDRLTFTSTGSPVIVDVALVPSNTNVFFAAGNATASATVNEDGVTGLGFAITASAGGPTNVTVRCIAASVTGGGSGSGSGSGSGGTADTTGEDAARTSDAVDAADAAIDGQRLPTTPAALPGAGTITGGALDGLRNERERINAAYFEAQRQRREILAGVFPGYEKAADDLKWKYLRSFAVSQAGAVELSEIETAADEGRIPAGLSEGQQKGMEAYFEALAELDAELDARLAEAGTQAEYAAADGKVRTLGAQQRALNSRISDLEYAERQTAADDAGQTFFTPRETGFDFAFSTDSLRRRAILALDGDADGAPDLPPLTIAGMPVNIWVRGRGTLFDRQSRGGNNGWAAHVLSGVALQLNGRVTVGAFGSYLAGRSKSGATRTEVESSKAGGGAYARIRLVDTLSLGLSASRETGEQDITTATATGTADTDLWSVSGSLQGSWVVRPLVLTPSFSVAYADSERSAYTDSSGTAIPGSRSRDTTLSTALTASQSFTYDEGWLRRVTPRASATLNYFARENESLRISATEVIGLEKWGGNVGAGVTLLTSGDSRISFDAGVIGIGQETLGYTGQIQVEIGF